MEIVKLLNTLENATVNDVIDTMTGIDDSITVKRFKDEEDILLVHNEFNNKGDNSILYDECRSFVVAVENGMAKIISYSHETIHEGKTFTEESLTEESFEGTLVSAFFYNSKWRFHTSRCTDIDSSYFYDSKTSFGDMFDDCLTRVGKDRLSFAENLNVEHMYSFVIVHHKNKYITDYSDRFGDNYAQLVLVVERERSTLELLNSEATEVYIVPRSGILDNSANCIIHRVFDETRNTFKYYKVYSDEYVREMKRNPNFSNIWYSYIQIFLNNEKEYNIDAFRQKKNITEEYVVANSPVNITGMIHLLYKETASLLMNLVTHFTVFNGDSYTKINSNDYELMDEPVYNNIKKQLAVLQNLVKNQIITNANGIVSHLRKHVSVYQFTHIVRGLIKLRQHDFFTLTNSYYINYGNFLLEQIGNK